MPKPDIREFDERYDSCFLDLGYKSAAGFVIGSMVSSFFLKAARWPIIVTTGIGVGMAYMNCENALNDFLLKNNPKLCIVKRRV